jgi:hypothetical protein
MSLHRLHHFIALGQSGAPADIDLLMGTLVAQADLSTFKLVDYALSHVTNAEGVSRMRHYLFHGQRPQRNYAALYFKRRGFADLLHEALAQGKIDWEQGFAE